MKTYYLTGLLAVGLLFAASAAEAVNVASGTSVIFPTNATIPAATGVNVVATQVNASNNQFGQVVTSLNFDTAGSLTFVPTTGNWLSQQFFAIDIGVAGGGANVGVVTKYTEGTLPSGQTHGLGYKATADFRKVTTAGVTQSETALAAGKKVLKDVAAGITTQPAELSGGFFRLYLAIFDGADASIKAAGGETFTNADRPGTYTGTLTVTATLS
ncbi:MAG: hypothetical protein HQL23_07540 [Candidatus Omnitrophica bacterium]|nr:hypothetical protein [Candidatus Omnitrophota bacterium]